MKKIFLLILFLTTFLNAQVNRNYIIYPSTVTQTEVFMTGSPVDKNVIWISANAIRFAPSLFISEGIYVTTNGGASWSGNDTCRGPNINSHSGDPGVAIDKNGTFILIRKDYTPGLYAHYSNDNGKTWSGRKTLSLDDLDRATILSDTIKNSAYYGRTYAVWVKYALPFPVYVTYTDNGGFTYSTPVPINNPSQRSQGGDIAISDNGNVFVAWAGVTNTSPFTETLVGLARSSNGGINWNIKENAFNMNGIQGILPQKQNIRVNGLPLIDIDESGGQRNGWIYVITTQRNFGAAGTDPDIILNRSTDGGETWSSGIRVNQDQLNNGKTQFFPAVHVDKFGAINVIFYDDRFTTSDSSGVMLSRSTDGGDTWKEYKVSNHNFKPYPIGGLGQGYQGDNIALKSVNDTLWPAWMDNSSGIYQVWTAPIDLNSLTSVKENESEIPSSFSLSQNYPNPFNPGTTISYSVPVASEIQLRIYDLLGNLIDTPIKDYHAPGNYSIQYNSGSLSSGIYFYELTSGSERIIKKMSLIK